jgi:agmatine/peptidylarginine deiminase
VRNTFKADPALDRAVRERRLVFFVVPHDTKWVRDYGPQIKTGANGGFVLVDPIYKDIRAQMGLERDRKAANLGRERLTKDFLKNNAGLLIGLPPKTPAAKVAELKDQLYVLQQFDDVLSNGKLNERQDDDFAPYEMVQAATGRAEIPVERPDLYLDGGNLLRLSDGRLLTTRQLFLQNRGKENQLTAQLKQHYGMKEVVYLDALPGPVIRHVDMFLLPAAGQRVLLASYEHLLKETPADPHVQVLVEHADQAMKRNRARLQKLGYEVIDVPALPPQVRGANVHYPTLLNALTLRTQTGGYAVILPHYPTLDPYAQFAAYKVIRAAFGEDVQLLHVDCTAAASQQGAVHCLTAVVPRRFSIFAAGPLAAGAKAP